MVLQYQIPVNDFSSAGEASSHFNTVLKKLGLPSQTIRRVAIAMYEAEINTVIHGGGGECKAEVNGDQIRITFRDHGPGIQDINLAMQAGYSTASEKIREMGFGAGMGLPNMQKYADELQIDTEIGKGTTLVLTVNL